MALFKCKMCGGALEINNNETVATCEYCGTQQTLPKLDDDRRANMYDRANHFRRNNEFDKAMGIYENILNEDNTDAEAYWSLVLCRYGIEYVEDPASHKRIPTVNRAQFTSIFDDDNYKSALRYADGYQRSIYEGEAKAINEIQKGILAISQKEEPFDVFICYKETDNNGRRTPDSVLANDLYHQLTQEGFKVFFSRITLEDKLGVAYEPYIFAALNSSKVMVALGTKPEYFNAVWVKNEWSRYLSLIKNGAKKILIPAYKDMDPYDLPEEFSHLQAQDMSKLGFMQDLIRGIKKIAQVDVPKATVVKETVVTNGNANTAALLKRVFMFLEDSDWNSANEYCEKVLDIDPESAQAYLGKLMAELRVSKQESLKDQAKPFDGMNNYQKALRFADDSLRTALNGYIEFINNRNEHDRLEEIYNKATSQKRTAKTEEEFKAAAATYGTIATYRDADALKQECLELAENARKDAIYNKAKSLFGRRSIPDIEQAINQFKTIPGWKDADEKVVECQQKIELIKREDEEKRIQDKKEKKIRTKKIIIGSSVGAAIAAVLVLLFTVIIPTINYNKADSLLAAGEYEAAMEGFRELNYKDSYEKYCAAFTAFKEGFEDTADQYLTAGDKINAAIYYTKAGMPLKAKEVFDFASILRAGQYMTAGISSDGKVYYQTNYEYDRNGEAEVQGMVRFLPDVGGFTGLTETGNLITHGISGTECLAGYYDEAKDTVDSWTGIVDFYDDYDNWYALMSDGTINTYIDDRDEEIRGTSSWKNIVSIQGFYGGIVGIDQDGHVLVAYKKGTPGSAMYSTDSWVDIQKVCKVSDMLIGIKSDNTLEVAYNAVGDIRLDAAVLSYTDVVDIVYSSPYLAILHKDGSVSMELAGSFTSTEKYVEKQKSYNKEVVEEITTWNGIVALYHGAGGYFGIRYDGTVKYVSDDVDDVSSGVGYSYRQNTDIKSEVESWTNIVWVDTSAISRIDIHWNYAVGLKTDGTVVSTGDGTYYTTEKKTYGDGYYKKYHSGGIYNDVSTWALW